MSPLDGLQLSSYVTLSPGERTRAALALLRLKRSVEAR